MSKYGLVSSKYTASSGRSSRSSCSSESYFSSDYGAYDADDISVSGSEASGYTASSRSSRPTHTPGRSKYDTAVADLATIVDYDPSDNATVRGGGYDCPPRNDFHEPSGTYSSPFPPASISAYTEALRNRGHFNIPLASGTQVAYANLPRNPLRPIQAARITTPNQSVEQQKP